MRNQLIRFFAFTSISAVLYFLASVPVIFAYTYNMKVGVAYWSLMTFWAVIIPLSVVIALIWGLDIWKPATVRRRVVIAAGALMAQVAGLASGVLAMVWPLLD